MKRAWLFLRYSLRLRRVEYRVAEIPIFLIPILLTVNDPAVFRGSVFWEGFFVFFFLFAVGDLVNCWADRDLDAIYKTHLSEAVDWLTGEGVLAQAAFSALASLALAWHLAWTQGRWLLPAAVVVANLTAWAYSAPPFRLKGRGWWQLIFYWLGLFVCPMLLASMFFVAWPPQPVWLVAFSYGLLQTGVILVNTAEDVPEDRQEGVRTIAVVLGIDRSMGLAAVLAGAGGTALLLSWKHLFREVGAGTQGLLPLGLATGIVCFQFVRLWLRSQGRPEADQVALARAHGPLCPLWITSVALTTLLAAALYFQAVVTPSRLLP